MARYIDADKIEYHYNYITSTSTLQQAGVAFKRDIEAMPKEDVVPVVHARWIKNKGYMLSCCSVCQNTIPLGREYKHKYCPNCGAKMDGREEA